MVIPAKKILAIKLRGVSELILWTGALQALRKAYPEAQIDILVPEDMSHVLKGSSLLQKVHLVPITGQTTLIQKFWSLRKEHYDLALAFDATPAVCRWIWLTGAKKICAHDHNRKKKSFWSNIAVDNPGEFADLLHLDAKLLTAIGFSEVVGGPKMFLDETLKQQALNRIDFAFDGTEKKTKIALMPVADTETKRYPRDQWLQTLDMLRKEKSVVLAVFADTSTVEAWDLRRECHRRDIRLYDDQDLRRYLATLSWFNLAICNDSVSLHMAASVGVKTLTLFGPGNLGRNHGYNREQHRILRMPVDCRPEGPRDNDRYQFCTLTTCSHHTCLKSIKPEQVVKAAL